MKSAVIQLPLIEVCIVEEPTNSHTYYKVLAFSKNQFGGVDEAPELEASGFQSVAEAEEYISELGKNYNVVHLRCIETFRRN